MELFDKLHEKMKQKEKVVLKANAFVGFDGFIDNIYKIKNTNDDALYIEDMESFGNRITSSAGKSCSFISKKTRTKLGGNMPIFSTALGLAGLNVMCVGAIGYPKINKIFENNMPEKCSLYGIAEPSLSTIYEFNNGKAIFSELESMSEITLENLDNIIGTDKILRMINDSEIIGFMNWSETPNLLQIWKSILNKLNQNDFGFKDSFLIFDLSDCSTKADYEIMECLETISSFSNFFNIVLCANENECNLIHKALFNNKSDIETMSKNIFKKLNINMLSIHTHNEAINITKDNFCIIPTFKVDNPKILTGAGDNFNAGLAIGLAMDLKGLDASIIGNLVSSFYVRNGKSPTFEELLNYIFDFKDYFLKNNQDIISRKS